MYFARSRFIIRSQKAERILDAIVKAAPKDGAFAEKGDHTSGVMKDSDWTELRELSAGVWSDLSVVRHGSDAIGRPQEKRSFKRGDLI